MKKRTLATHAASTEIPVKPNKPAIIAIIKKISDHLSIKLLLYL